MMVFRNPIVSCINSKTLLGKAINKAKLFPQNSRQLNKDITGYALPCKYGRKGENLRIPAKMTQTDHTGCMPGPCHVLSTGI